MVRHLFSDPCSFPSASLCAVSFSDGAFCGVYVVAPVHRASPRPGSRPRWRGATWGRPAVSTETTSRAGPCAGSREPHAVAARARARACVLCVWVSACTYGIVRFCVAVRVIRCLALCAAPAIQLSTRCVCVRRPRVRSGRRALCVLFVHIRVYRPPSWLAALASSLHLCDRHTPRSAVKLYVWVGARVLVSVLCTRGLCCVGAYPGTYCVTVSQFVGRSECVRCACARGGDARRPLIWGVG